jgi:hypothetical protein
MEAEILELLNTWDDAPFVPDALNAEAAAYDESLRDRAEYWQEAIR